MSKVSIIQRFAKSALGVLVARLLAFVSVFGFNAVLARTMAPADFGQFLLLFSLAGLASLVACGGMNRALVKVLAEMGIPESPEVAKGLVNTGFLTGVIGGAVVGTLSGFVAWILLPVSDANQALTVAGLFAVVVWLRTIHLVLAETARGFHEKIWSNFFGGPAGGPIPHVVFLALLFGYLAFTKEHTLTMALVLYLSAFAVTLPALLVRVYTLRHSKAVEHSAAVNPDELKFGALMLVALPLMFTQTFGLTMSQADIWIAGAMAAPAALAIYCGAQRMLAFLTIPLQIAGTAIVSFVPELIHLKKLEKLQQMVGLAATGAGLPGLAIGCVFLAFPEFILGVAFGEYYVQGANLLRILVVGQMICIFTGPCEIVLMMAGHQNKTLVVNALAAVAIFTCGPLGILFYGMTGLAVALSTVTSAQNLCNWYLAKRFVGVSTNVGAVDMKQITSEFQKLKTRLTCPNSHPKATP